MATGTDGNDGIFDPTQDVEVSEPLSTGKQPSSRQKPLAIRTSDYPEVGYVGMVPHADGGLRVAGEAGADPALPLEDDNLVCIEAPGRPACKHYIAILTEAEGFVKGVTEQPRQIRRYCKALSTASELMEVGENAIYACTARSPFDLISAERITRFEKKQKEVSAELAQTSDESVL